MNFWRFPLIPISKTYECLMDVRNALYDHNILAIQNSKIPVISVGNMTMGGTGKTPVLSELLTWCEKNNVVAGVVSRGYGRQGSGNEEVTGADAERFGDEPVMLKSRFPKTPVYVGADRSESIVLLLKKYPVQIVFADDAFQHRSLGRACDIVVVDCMEPKHNTWVIPAGRARESMAGMSRANFIILNRVNLVSEKIRNEWISFIQKYNNGKDNIIYSEYYLDGLMPLKSASSNNLAVNSKVLLVSGVGVPQSVEILLSKQFQIQKHLIFKDHHKYTQNDIEQILSAAKELGTDNVVVTEKDAVKLSAFNITGANFWFMKLGLNFSPNMKELYEEISRLSL